MDNKTVIVTGGANGIGKEIALQLINAGWNVHVLDIQEPDFECVYSRVDISKEEDIKKAFETITSLSALVNNAGVYFQKAVEETEKSELDLMVDVNIKGTYLMCKHALPLLKASKGSIINMSSCLGLITEPNSALYSTTKAGLTMLTKSLAIDYAKYGIRTNAVLPGATDTNMVRRFLPSDEEIQLHGKKKPLGRIGTPKDIANMCRFLLSAEASYINGACISVDGGEAATSLYTVVN